MRYKSTRGRHWMTFEEVLFSGYASDHGLFVPEVIPQVTQTTLESWKTLSYTDLVKRVVSLFITASEIPEQDLYTLIDRAYAKFDIRDVVRKVSFGDLHIIELWHGPTLAFKDLAMLCVGELYDYFICKQKKHVTVLISTSGDTGSSAIEAVRGKSNIDIIVILPHNRISKVQELMMTTVLDDNVHVYTADGFSDEFDVTLKKIQSDAQFTSKHNLCSINSLNWARVMVQIVHHIYMYLQCAEVIGAPVEIVIPTGGCGNVASGMFAQAMGVPINLTSVVNENDIVHRACRRNDFSVAPNVIQTFACSMDIQRPANIERIFWILSNGDCETVQKVMHEFDCSGRAVLSKELFERVKTSIQTAVACDRHMIAAMKRCWNENRYIACPHTCAALAYYYGILKHGTRETTGTNCDDGKPAPCVCASTASACKFPDVVKEAGLQVQNVPKRVQELFNKPTRSIHLKKEDDWEKTIRDKIISISKMHGL